MQDEAQCRAAVFCRQKRASAACVNHHPVGKEMYVEVWFCRLTCSILRSKRSLPPENWQLLAGAASFCRQRKTIFCKECAVEISGFGSNMLCPGHYLYVFISGNYPHKNADFIPPNFAKFLLTFLDYSKIQIDLHWFCSINNIWRSFNFQRCHRIRIPMLVFSSPVVSTLKLPALLCIN